MKLSWNRARSRSLGSPLDELQTNSVFWNELASATVLLSRSYLLKELASDGPKGRC